MQQQTRTDDSSVQVSSRQMTQAIGVIFAVVGAAMVVYNKRLAHAMLVGQKASLEALGLPKRLNDWLAPKDGSKGDRAWHV
jgi:hypothetical protein